MFTYNHIYTLLQTSYLTHKNLKSILSPDTENMAVIDQSIFDWNLNGGLSTRPKGKCSLSDPNKDGTSASMQEKKLSDQDNKILSFQVYKWLKISFRYKLTDEMTQKVLSGYQLSKCNRHYLNWQKL